MSGAIEGLPHIDARLQQLRRELGDRLVRVKRFVHEAIKQYHGGYWDVLGGYDTWAFEEASSLNQGESERLF